MGRGAASVGGESSWRGEPGGAGAALTLAGVVLRGSTPARLATPGISLQVPPGQTVALASQPAASAIDLLDVLAGLRRPLSGQVSVDGIAVDRLRGRDLDRYRADRGLLAARFPLLPSLSVTDNVLAGRLSRHVDHAMRARAGHLLAMTGAAQLASDPVDILTPEQQWRVLIARALLPFPRLVLAEDPAPSMDPRAATAVLDVLLDAHARFGFTLLLSVSRIATASRCERLVSIVGGVIAEDEMTRADDAGTRGRIDRIG
ncbi:MAG TPA: ATP-binding cassette domain-containing protein [Streptosporangiaceae bacterium]|nr:ATP-binding cassette domain-containing protein [Streptosporangiaceae bacterium]